MDCDECRDVGVVDGCPFCGKQRDIFNSADRPGEYERLKEAYSRYFIGQADALIEFLEKRVRQLASAVEQLEYVIRQAEAEGGDLSGLF